ncbi:NADP oxidoreductase [Thiomicrospira sp. ALE5]|uniref:NADP oxidoreductase n=1 Tax=Thiomicrospira sp. ALE5 TaxID=748650 RepID=UPI0008E630C9|nr:NADP oxidoreductase [Thiomicrospira sp. ALE5]SFR61443.1 sulfite reductase (NADPH) flavoprotein alpha-component [Thiomicrospira sp. ALE5]
MQARLIEKTPLTHASVSQPAWLVTLETDELLDYQPGDWVTVLGTNRIEWANAILAQLNLAPDSMVSLRRVGDVCALDALVYHLEITFLDPALLGKLGRQFGFNLWPDRHLMRAYADSRDLLDLLIEYPKIAQLGEQLLPLLTPLLPRYYSIASAPNSMAPNRLQILFKQLEIQQHGRTRYGVTSTSLATSQLGETFSIAIKANPQFKLPANPQTPVTMIAAGTGLAPFLGFMQARAAQGASQNHLYFGETHAEQRFLAQKQLSAWQQAGLLNLVTAFSRDPQPVGYPTPYYVQDALLKQQAWLADWQAEGHIYVCGSKQGVAKGVEAAIKQAWSTHGLFSDVDQAWLDARKLGRIQLDVY